MIIKNIKAKRFDINNKSSIRLILKTSNGKYKSKIGLDSDLLYTKEQIDSDINFINKVLKNKIRDIEIKNFEDLRIIEDLIKKDNPNIHKNTLLLIEQSILKAISKGMFWDFIDKDVKQIPRPMGIIFGRSIIKQSCDFKQILLISFNANNFSRAISANLRVHELLEKEIKNYDKNFKSEVNLEGALVANISNYDILDILKRICKQVSEEVKFDLRVGINFDASYLYNDGYYNYRNYSSSEREKKLNKKEQINFVLDLVNRYDLFYIEDPLMKDDLKGFIQIKKKVNCLVSGNKIINDDIKSFDSVIKNNCINTYMLNLNKVGSLLEAWNLIENSKKNKIYVITETFNYETDDNFLVQFSIAFHLPVIKYGIYKKDRNKIEEINKIEKLIKTK